MVIALSNHRRVIAFLLLLLFCIFALFTIPVLEANAFVLTLGTAAIATLATVLTMGGIVFASTQDMSVGVNGFYNNSITQDTQMAAFTSALLAAPVVDGVLQLGEDLSTGWSYFWEHASDYFGVETGVKPEVAIDDSQGFVDNFVQYGDYSLKAFQGHDVQIPFSSCDSTYYLDSSLDCPKAYLGTPKQIPYLQNIARFTIGSVVLETAFIYCSSYNSFSLTCSVDGWNTTLGGASMSYPAFNTDRKVQYFLNYLNGSFAVYAVVQTSQSNDSSLGIRIFGSNLLGALDGTFGGSICPDYDTGGEDTLYTGQDVFDAMDSVLDADYADVVIDVGLIADILTEQGLGKDIALNITQSDVIPDAIAKELDTTKPGPSPTPSASPEPSPNPDNPDREFPKVPKDISKYFPFSLPFDLVYLIGKFQAEPEAPKFVIPVDFSFVGIEEEWVIDMADFETVVVVFRFTVIAGFLLGLLFVTRKLMM